MNKNNYILLVIIGALILIKNIKKKKNYIKNY
jgi:hypothetical protein